MLSKRKGIKNMTKKKIEFMNIVNRWLKEKSLEISPSTYEKYEGLSINYINPFFSKTYCEDLDSAILNNFYIQLLSGNNTKKLSNGNLRIIIMIINKSCDLAYKEGFSKQNLYLKPCLSKKKPIVQTLTKIKQKKLKNIY